MKNVFRALLFIGMLALVGCAGFPAKKDTAMANYSKLIVRPIDFNDTTTDKIDGAEVAEYKASWAALSSKFQTELEKNVKKSGYFDEISFSKDAVADKNTVVLEPKIVSLDPGIRWVMPGQAYFQGILKNPEGKVIGKYAAKRTVSRPITSTMGGAIDSLVSELGEDAGAQIGEAKL